MPRITVKKLYSWNCLTCVVQFLVVLCVRLDRREVCHLCDLCVPVHPCLILMGAVDVLQRAGESQRGGCGTCILGAPQCATGF
eukprot:m.474822 g.474822  ORF g.474822 m.474822 type:complete len:83 (-) comp21681_c0_seq2:397-645(-)